MLSPPVSSSLITPSINNSSSAIVLAQALNIQGRLQLATGQTEAALDTWKKAEASYTKAGDENWNF